jgi:GT2 family glycosyltransferase
MTSVRVGVVSWNTGVLLDRCLSALPAALDGVDAEVVVVDNASSDGSADIAERHRHVTVVRNKDNVGYARGMNRALSGCAADVLVALNPDTEPPPHSLSTLVERLVRAPDVGLVVPRLTYPDGQVQHSAYRFPSPRQAATILLTPNPLLRRGIGARWWAEGYSPHDRASDIDWAIGAVHVIRADALDGALPYDESFFMYVEDLDLCWRLAQAGWRRRLEPDVEIQHVGNAAGAQAWGETRAARWMDLTYRWYARTFGRGATRSYAAVNVLAILVHVLGLAPLALLGSERRRARLRELGRVAPAHLRALVLP